MFLESIVNVIANNPHAAYLVVFLISLSESLAFVGLLVPGTVLMFGVGAVIATGALSLKPTLIVATAGAIAGDGISYWLGRYYHQRLRNLWPFHHHPQLLSRGETFFLRHGGKSVLFGRFVGPVRPVIPIVAGMLDMPPMKFTLVNVLSAVGWAFAYILPGVFFGTSLRLAGAVSARLAVLVLLMVGTVWVFLWICRKLVLFVGHLGPQWLVSLQAWVSSDTPVRGVMLSLRRFLSFLFLRQKAEEFLLAFLVLVLFLTGWGFLGILQDVLMRDPLVRADQAVYHFLQSLRNPWGDHIFVTITELGDGLINSLIAGALFLALLFRRCYRAAGYWLSALIGGACLIKILKWTLHLPRPVVLYHGLSAFGFPSGHTTMSVILYGFLAILIAKDLRNTMRWGLFVTVFLISFGIAFSRLYLGVHWLSDVLGGFFLASAWTALAGIGYLKGRPEVIPRRLLILVALMVFLTAGFWHVADRHSKDLVFYAPRRSVHMVSLQTWMEKGWEKLPAWRIDLGGEREQPLTIQWAGDPASSADYLVSKGWQTPPALSVKTFLGILSPDTQVQNLPLLPHLHDGRREKVLLVRDGGGERLVFRLWPTDMQLKEEGRSLWVGTIETQVAHRIADFITVPRDKGDYMRPLEILSQTLKGRFRLREAIREGEELGSGDEPHGLVWNGRVVLIMSRFPNPS
ncbi:MAG: VTT domain-containing protein [Thermodesulfobacteriota bacterium]